MLLLVMPNIGGDIISHMGVSPEWVKSKRRKRRRREKKKERKLVITMASSTLQWANVNLMVKSKIGTRSSVVLGLCKLSCFHQCFLPETVFVLPKCLLDPTSNLFTRKFPNESGGDLGDMLLAWTPFPWYSYCNYNWTMTMADMQIYMLNAPT